MNSMSPFAILTAAALLACGTAGGPGGPGEGAYAPEGQSPAAEEPATAEEPPPAAGEAIPFETLAQRSIPGKGGGEVREVVRDAAAWQPIWEDLTGADLPQEAPAVDFEERMVIAAAMPTQGCISRVTIREVRAEGDGLVVDLLERPPAEGIACIVSERPFHAVSLPRHDGPVRWEVEQRPLDPSAGQGQAGPG